MLAASDAIAINVPILLAIWLFGTVFIAIYFPYKFHGSSAHPET